MKLYGVVKAVKGDAGKQFFQLESLDNKNKGELFVVFFGSHPDIKADVKLAVQVTQEGTFYKPVGEFKFYTQNKAVSGGANNKSIGISVGHALNAGMILTGDSLDGLIDACKVASDVTEIIKKEVKQANPKMDDYSVGASSGNAVLNACKVLAKSSPTEDELLEKTRYFISEVTPVIAEYISSQQGS